MTKAQRAKYIIAAPVFVFATVIAQFGSSVSVSAAAVTWDGGAGDGKFSTAQNWSNDAVPSNGDQLTFNASVAMGSTNVELDNDISGLSVDGVTYTGSTSGYASLIIGGNALTVTGDITNNATQTDGYAKSLSFTAPVVFATNANVSAVSFSAINVGSNTVTLNAPAETCGFSTGLITGSGSLVTTGGDQYANYALPNSGTSSFSGTITANSGRFIVTAANALTANATVATAGSGSVILAGSSNSTFPIGLNLSGSGVVRASQNWGSCSGSGPQAPFTTTVTGPVVLGSDYRFEGENNLVLTGTYTTNGHSFTTNNGSAGSLTTPSGSSEAQPFTTQLDGDQPNQYANVGNKETAVLNGTRGSINVGIGGVLKGTGTASSVNNNGIVSPGNSPGTITVLGNYTEYGTYQVEIQNKTNYDKLVVGNETDGSGGVQIDAASKLDVVLYSGWSFAAGDTFTIIDNKSNTPINGTYEGLAEGTQFTVGTAVFRVSYVGGTGNDLVLTAVNSVSAPNTGVLQLVKANPALVAILGLVSAASILAIALRRKSIR